MDAARPVTTATRSCSRTTAPARAERNSQVIKQSAATPTTDANGKLSARSVSVTTLAAAQPVRHNPTTAGRQAGRASAYFRSSPAEARSEEHTSELQSHSFD